MSTPVSEVIEACAGIRDLAHRRDELARRREAAIRALRAQGIGVRVISRMLTEALGDAGFTPAEVRGLGVSPAAVRLALNRPRV